MNLNNIDYQEFEKRILYEDNHLIIVNKMSGELVQADETGDVPLLEKVRSYIRIKYEKPGNVFCGLVHRIDRPVSGAVIFAKTSKALNRITEMIKQREVSKYYWAIVEGQMPENSQHLVNYLRKNQEKNKSFVSDEEKPNWKRSELIYNVLAVSENYSLVEVQLLTGRHHQIRAQLSHLGNTIKGDLKYGAKRSEPDGSICLHSRRLEFIHPVSKEPVSVLAEPYNPLFNKLLASNLD